MTLARFASITSRESIFDVTNRRTKVKGGRSLGNTCKGAVLTNCVCRSAGFYCAMRLGAAPVGGGDVLGVGYHTGPRRRPPSRLFSVLQSSAVRSPQSGSPAVRAAFLSPKFFYST